MRQVLLLQGPGSYKNIISNWYEDDVIYSTWEGIATPFTKTLNLKKPDNPGVGNSNLQFYGSLKGVEYASNIGYDYVLKVRDDLLISEYGKLLQNLDLSSLAFTAFHNWSGGYLVDYVIGGPVDLLKAIWDFDTSNSSDFSERVLFNRIKTLGINKVQYLYPLMKNLGITCYSLKWDKELVAAAESDSLFTYPEVI